ncbi:MAG: chromosome segregation protein SMC [Christensenellaceae bacterium]|nr:chromosome segregation protein SMC [Christensenellaceae bacterium]MDD6927613.1 chromosome segregation protein SMC [bacterium]MDY2850821.1 chromosome segregation protein SMC [Christensenellaceae bacterium]
MNFTKIEIIGFKSFANKTEIRFDHGITGIVGPNGCGKSNVADAIRWVLGEQSPKSLRGSNMQDVIFNGTQNRKSLSYCEVSLFFDNSNGIFKSIEYTEVILTRKLYRSGESEYYVNNKPSRLKDIVNLLHECGLSKEGYTIIGQNKVTEILSSKPQDRRAIFEEAVGISKTKQQRLEAERKLQKVNDNITRFSDICMDLERQLAPLSRQAETARTYNALTEELKKCEVNSYLYKVDNSSGEKGAINARIEVLNDTLAQKKADFNLQESIYNDSMASVGKTDEEIKDLNNQILDKTVGLEEQKGNAKLYKQKIDFFNEEIERLRKENSDNQAKINSDAAALADKKSYDIKAENELQTLISKAEQISSKLVEIIKEINFNESSSKEETNRIIDSIKELSDLKSSSASLSAEQAAVEERKNETLLKLDALRDKIKSLGKEKQTVSDRISAINKEISSLVEEIEASENGVKITNDKLSDINNKLFSINNSITTIEANEKFYKGLKESFEGFQEAVRRLMNAAKTDREVEKRIKGVVASLVHTDRKYEVAMEIAMGGAIQNIVTANENDASFLIEYLKRNGWGRATFLPVSAIKYRTDSSEIMSAKNETGALGLAAKLVTYDAYFEPVIRYLLGNTLICDTLDHAVAIARKYRFAFKIVTLDGDVLSPQGSMTGGSRKQTGSNILSVDGKLEGFQKDLERLRNDYEAANKKKNQYVQTLASLNNDLSEMNAQYNDKKQESVALKEKLNAIENSVSEAEKDEYSYREVLKAINTRLQEIERQVSDMEEGKQSLENANTEKTTERQKKEGYYDELKKERDNLIAQNTECQAKVAGLKSSIASNKTDIERLSTEVANLRVLIRDNDKTIQNDLDIIAKLKEDAEKLILSSEDQKTVALLREKLKRAEDRKETLQRDIESSNTRRTQLNDEINTLTESKLKEEFNLEKVDADLRNSAEQLMRDYELAYEDCLALRAENYDHKQNLVDIDKIKRKIRGLGPINNNAIADYEAINSVYQDNLLQKNDLEKGADDLRTGIESLTQEMTTKFNAGFEVIRSNFRRIFKELFGGGSADLLLDYEDCDDPLEAGVEIVAEPPGKKLQKISLLSGGEMALTAIAILFAILRLCPMPFCVLDEIEAALDEANVERFARYLKNFSAETQFIVITHKKVTMELADALYGVTMQEKGVSSIVSVELSEINDIETA